MRSWCIRRGLEWGEGRENGRGDGDEGGWMDVLGNLIERGSIFDPPKTGSHTYSGRFLHAFYRLTSGSHLGAGFGSSV